MEYLRLPTSVLRFVRVALLLSAAALCPAACNDDGGTLPVVEPDLSTNQFPDFGIDCPHNVFPQFDRNCQVPADCDVVEHQLDCCGSLRYMGIAARAADKFSSFEATCRGTLGKCGCPASLPVDDSGKSLGMGDKIQLLCLAGTCTTQAP